MDQRILVIAATLELFALNDPARAGSAPGSYVSSHFREVMAVSITPQSAISGRSITKLHTDSFTTDQKGVDSYPPFNCMELQVIDEAELLGGTVDCD